MKEVTAMSNYKFETLQLHVGQEQERQGKLRVFHLGSFTQPRKFYLIFQEGPYLPKAAETFIRYLRELHQKQAL